MARIELTQRFCQNKMCRHQFEVGEITWPPPTFSRDKLDKKVICPQCGFKTGTRHDLIGVQEIIKSLRGEMV